MVDVWQHLFLTGEFADRAHLLSGLTPEQAGVRPAGAPHSIYEELWHAAEWQRIVLEQDKTALERWEQGGQFPADPVPEDEAAWQALVDSFLTYSERAVELAQDETWLNTEETDDNPGFTWRNALEVLAVHSAYHLGKIVLLRQFLGCWHSPPKDH